MDTEDLVVDDHTQCQKVEHIGEIMPDIRITVFSCTFGVKAVGLGDAS